MITASQDKVRLPVLQAKHAVPLEVPLALPEAPYRPADIPLIDRRALPLDGRPHRASSYTIYVDLPGNTEEMLLVHAYTGAYDKVSRRVATYLRSLESRHAPKPLYGDWSPVPRVEGEVLPPSDEAIARLKKRGYMTQMTPDEEEAFFTDFASKVHLRSIHRRPGYILMPTYQCNLRCLYCFQDHMRTDSAYGHLLQTMNRRMVDRVFAGMKQIEAAHGIFEDGDMPRDITLFGGEPLLEESRPIIEYIIHKALEPGKANISAITNGTDLHAYEDLLGPGKISFLQITVDGPPREHDKRRIYADGSGSFERIARNVDMALERGVQIGMRMNIDRNNIELLPHIANEFVARGWYERPGFSAYVAPVHGEREPANGKTTFTSWQLNQAMAELKARHPNVARISFGDGNLMHRVRRLFGMREDPLPAFRSVYCSAHTTMYVVDPFGDLYACWERTGNASLRMGHIADSGDVFMRREIMEAWRSRNVTSNPVCRKCRYAPYCGGGCAALAEEHGGDMHKSYCDGFAKRFRASVAGAYLEHQAGVRVSNRVEQSCDA